jgi:hypothetical protein
MICAFLDYVRYRMKTGPYGPDPSKNLAALGYPNRILDQILDTLRSGDVIFIQDLNSIFTWGTMYFESSFFNHVAMYVYKDKILHQTLSYSKLHPIRVLFKKNRRIVIIRMPVAADEPRTPNDDPFTRARPEEKLLILKSKLSIIFKTLPLTVMNCSRDRFRMRFLVDGIATTLISAAAIRLGTGYIYSYILPVLYVAVVCVNALRWKIDELSVKQKFVPSHLGTAAFQMLKAGDTLLINYEAVKRSEEAMRLQSRNQRQSELQRKESLLLPRR